MKVVISGARDDDGDVCIDDDIANNFKYAGILENVEVLDSAVEEQTPRAKIAFEEKTLRWSGNHNFQSWLEEEFF